MFLLPRWGTSTNHVLRPVTQRIYLRAVFSSLGALGDVNIGIVALLVNIVVLAVVSLATRPSKTAGRVGYPTDPSA